MDSPRDFTRKLLAQISQEERPRAGPASATPLPVTLGQAACPAGGLLVAADITCANAAPLVREALSLRRFGVAVTVLADEALAQRMGRQLPPDSLHISTGPLNGEALGSARLALVASGPSLLAKAALGLRDTVAADALLLGLWHGLPVYTDLACTRQDDDGKPCQNPALAAMYQNYEKQLREMGVHHLARGEVLAVLLPLLQQPEAPATASDTPTANENGRVFITQRDVRAYQGPSEWVLPQNAIVTAAAKDEAARRKITLRRPGRP